MEQDGPTHLGPYVVLEQIGSGGMGAVYRARDQRLERDVAIKVLHRHLAMEGARERFLREARAVSSLNHPNISTIFDMGEHEGDPYLVMELLHGASLKEHLDSGVLMPLDELISIAIQAAKALAAAHAKGIVHRDIKPANLFLADGPGGRQLKVLDFGLAKIESERLLYGDSHGLTRTGSTVGTVEYMSPEQARGEDLDPRSDLFSLGAVLYELATGDVPFRGATSAVVFAELLGSDPVPPRKANARISVGMDSVIRKLLEKKREKRTPSANVLLEELRRLREFPVRAGASTLPAPHISDPLPRNSRRTVDTELGLRTVRGRTPSGNPRSSIRNVTVTNPLPSDDRAGGDSPAFGTVHKWPPMTVVPDNKEPRRWNRILWWSFAVVVLTVSIVGTGLYLRSHGADAAGMSVVTNGLQITQFQNSTGNILLRDVPAISIEILLRELPTLHVMGFLPGQNLQSLSPSDIAQRSGADAYLTGAISQEAGRYHIHAEILRTADAKRLAVEDVDAGSDAQLPEALTRLAIALRAHLGETPEQATANTVPLATAATGSLKALAMYADGTWLLRGGKSVAAILQFRQALSEDSSFVPARLDLIESLRQAGAETERLEAAAALKVSANKGGACQKARIAYELSEAASALPAAQAWADVCIFQPGAQLALARAQLASGHSAAAETSGSRAVQLDPADQATSAIATEAMIAQAHFESAEKEQAKAATWNAASSGLALLAADLRGSDAEVAAQAAAAQTSTNFSDAWHYVTYLSNRGQLAQARSFGEAAARRFAAETVVASSANLMRARLAAIDAMAGHCGASVTVPANAGDSTKFFAGLAAAWCKKPNTADAPTDPALSGAVRAATIWSTGDAQGALNLLQGVRDSNQSLVAALLRGQAHLALSQQVLAISDFKGVIAHRGEAELTGTLVYPAAQAGLAAAYRTMGDAPNADRAEADLRKTWKDAAPTEPLLRTVTK